MSGNFLKERFTNLGAVHRIRTCKPFTVNRFQVGSLTTRTHGILMAEEGRFELPHPFRSSALAVHPLRPLEYSSVNK